MPAPRISLIIWYRLFLVIQPLSPHIGSSSSRAFLIWAFTPVYWSADRVKRIYRIRLHSDRTFSGAPIDLPLISCGHSCPVLEKLARFVSMCGGIVHTSQTLLYSLPAEEGIAPCYRRFLPLLSNAFSMSLHLDTMFDIDCIIDPLWDDRSLTSRVLKLPCHSNSTRFATAAPLSLTFDWQSGSPDSTHSLVGQAEREIIQNEESRTVSPHTHPLSLPSSRSSPLSSLALSPISILSRCLLPSSFLFAGHFHLSLSCIFLLPSPPPLPSLSHFAMGGLRKSVGSHFHSLFLAWIYVNTC